MLGCSLAFTAAIIFPEAERDESSANMSQSTANTEEKSPRTDPCGTPNSTQPSGE